MRKAENITYKGKHGPVSKTTLPSDSERGATKTEGTSQATLPFAHGASQSHRADEPVPPQGVSAVSAHGSLRLAHTDGLLNPIAAQSRSPSNASLSRHKPTPPGPVSPLTPIADLPATGPDPDPDPLLRPRGLS